MEHKITGLAEQLIRYQQKHGLTDSEMALASHFSVERIHTFKTDRDEPTADELEELQRLLSNDNPTVEEKR